MPTRFKAFANACEPRMSAPMSRLSKWREFENCSKIAEGPSAKRPPQSFMELIVKNLRAQAAPSLVRVQNERTGRTCPLCAFKLAHRPHLSVVRAQISAQAALVRCARSNYS